MVIRMLGYMDNDYDNDNITANNDDNGRLIYG